jgi:hypothetical protein
LSSNCVHGEVYSIQHYLIKFGSDLRRGGGFLWVPPPINWTLQYNWNPPVPSAHPLSHPRNHNFLLIWSQHCLYICIKFIDIILQHAIFIKAKIICNHFYNWNIVKSGVKHHKTNQPMFIIQYTRICSG